MSSILSTHTKGHTIKYKYGVKVTQHLKVAIKFYQENSNTLWKEMIGREMAHKKYSKILTSSHLFYINFDLRRKARLVKWLFVTGYIDDDAYCGVVKIDLSSLERSMI